MFFRMFFFVEGRAIEFTGQEPLSSCGLPSKSAHYWGTILYGLGSTHLWSGFPFVWTDCLLILALPFHGRCGYYFDWFAFSMDVVFYAGWGYVLLGCYKLLRNARHSPANLSPPAL
ncbi:MAG: hypothetical protein AUI50_00380 [Crenarchaeota archaeon 13_1_40CM_2_52_14]|nr:MAG: hypothetical protein AUI97_06280 [Crenarchaeota archaeon 13_1_40CM_3_52_17]OLD35812.1 MAG: hypothetical protein AUI50_00380 [Crenarchaeota archaeon 13_1_40CM_2_52_14]OLE69458.1 MAG: hypothetical protein AUF78_10920 [archaeon 13_1_20CM_2_51_12]